MSLRDRVFRSEDVATATVATLAAPSKKDRVIRLVSAPTVAGVASVAVAKSETVKNTNAQPQQLTKRKGTRRKPSPVALNWLEKNRQELKASRWTMPELYRRNKSKGIAWCSLWDKPFLEVYLHNNGVIEFEAVIDGRDVVQTARPESSWNKKHNG